MKMNVRISESVTVSVEGDTHRDVFEQLAPIYEVFGQSTCGKCKKGNVFPVVRTDTEDNKYYELRCKDCRAVLSFGCHKVGGGLFPKRKNDEGYLPDGGWMRWDPELKKSV
jgi:hypothetical protein